MAQNKNNNKNGGDCCSFCGAKRTDVEIMFQGSDGANICNKCIENGYKIIVDNDIASERGRRPAAAPLKMEELLKPAQIKEFLDQYVIGQDAAKRALDKDISKLVLPLPDKFDIEICFKEHINAFKGSFYPGVTRTSTNTVCFHTNDWYEVLRALFYIL